MSDRNFKWFNVLAIVVGIVALVAVIIYLVRKLDLLARLPFQNHEPEIEE